MATDLDSELLSQLITSVSKLNTNVAVLTAQVESLDHRLFGNGQPGIIDGMFKRIGKLENWRWYVMGVAVGLGGVIGAALMHAAEGTVMK